jgi:hypothetical protein
MASMDGASKDESRHHQGGGYRDGERRGSSRVGIERNAAHGLQLSQEDKENMAPRIYGMTPERGRERKKVALARILSVTVRTVQDWLSRIDKDAKEARNQRIFDMWLSCHTQEEISERENLDRTVISDMGKGFVEFGNLSENHKTMASHADEKFDVPLYNICKRRAAGTTDDSGGIVLGPLESGVPTATCRGAG